MPVPLEKMRYAAVNHLYIKLAYRKGGVHLKDYLFEPYSLWRTQSDDLLLYAVKEGEKQAKNFRVDWMQGIEVMNKPFIPQYKIEFASAGLTKASVISRKPDKKYSPKISRISRSAKSNSSGIKYIYQCSYCQRKFPRLQNINKLKPHKDKNGCDCSGRAGYFVEMKF